MVHFFLTMLFSTSSDLGWDPTVQRVRSLSGDPSPRYDYTVEDADGTQTVYRTAGLIAESDKDSSFRGLRIWEAFEVRDGIPHGDIVVLKDTWRLKDIEQEGSNMRAVMEPPSNSTMSEESRKALEHSVLTVLHHGDVIIRPGRPGADSSMSYPDEADRHIVGYFKTLPWELRSRYMINTKWRGANWGASISNRRIHYRMVVKELCGSLHGIRRDHQKVYAALAEVCEGESSFHFVYFHSFMTVLTVFSTFLRSCLPQQVSVVYIRTAGCTTISAWATSSSMPRAARASPISSSRRSSRRE